MRKKTAIFAAIIVIAIVSFCFSACNTVFEDEAKAVDLLQKALRDASSAQAFFIKETYSQQTEANESGVTSTNTKYFNMQFDGNASMYLNVSETVNTPSGNMFLTDMKAAEYWWNSAYETEEESKTGNASLKKQILTKREYSTLDTLVEGKKQTEEKQFASYRLCDKESLLQDSTFVQHSIDTVLSKFVDLFSSSENYTLVKAISKGKLDHYYVEVSETFDAELASYGQFRFSVLNTEQYNRVTSISTVGDNNDDFNDVYDKDYTLYTNYAGPKIGGIDCAERYVQSINNPEEEDKTMMYVLIGVGCGVGIPLIALLVWLIIRRIRFFNDFDPETMDLDEYIKERETPKQKAKREKREAAAAQKAQQKAEKQQKAQNNTENPSVNNEDAKNDEEGKHE